MHTTKRQFLDEMLHWSYHSTHLMDALTTLAMKFTIFAINNEISRDMGREPKDDWSKSFCENCNQIDTHLASAKMN